MPQSQNDGLNPKITLFKSNAAKREIPGRGINHNAVKTLTGNKFWRLKEPGLFSLEKLGLREDEEEI